jgi:hypothetical protein
MCQNCLWIEFPLLCITIFFKVNPYYIFIFLLENLFFYNEFHSNVKDSVHCNCILINKNLVFYCLILGIQWVVLWFAMVSEKDRFFYGVHSNRNIVATKLLHISELISCIRPFVFYDSDFDNLKVTILLPDKHYVAYISFYKNILLIYIYIYIYIYMLQRTAVYLVNWQSVPKFLTNTQWLVSH